VKKKTTLKKPRGKMLKTEDEDEEDTRARWKDEDIEMLIALRGEMDDDFKKTAKNKVTKVFLKWVFLGFMYSILTPPIPVELGFNLVVRIEGVVHIEFWFFSCYFSNFQSLHLPFLWNWVFLGITESNLSSLFFCGIVEVPELC
jgi:hypothetical protein